jgi:4-hydroxy 2-oxovalerate aldolase
MNTAILDVTLREGGFRNNWDFTPGNAEQIVSGVTGAGIDFVEIGYRNFPPGYSGNDVGLTRKTSDDYVKALRQSAPTAKLAVMYYAGAVTNADLEALASLGVAMVRCDIPVNQIAPPPGRWSSPDRLDATAICIGGELCR